MATFVGSLFLMKQVGSEFFPTADDARMSVNLEMPIGTRAEITREVTDRLVKEWQQKYPEIMTINYTSGTASSDNTFASLSDNGPHIVDMNIRLLDPGDRERGIVEIAGLMREDLKQYPEYKKAQVRVGGNMGMGGQATVDFEIYGYDFTATDSVAARLRRELLEIPARPTCLFHAPTISPSFR